MSSKNVSSDGIKWLFIGQMREIIDLRVVSNPELQQDKVSFLIFRSLLTILVFWTDWNDRWFIIAETVSLLGISWVNFTSFYGNLQTPLGRADRRELESHLFYST